MAQTMNSFWRTLIQNLPDEQKTEPQSKEILERLQTLGIRAKRQELDGYSQTIFLYENLFFPMGTSLSNPTLINFLKSEFNIQ